MVETNTLLKIPNLFRSTWLFVRKNWIKLLFLIGLPIGFQQLFIYINRLLLPLLASLGPLISSFYSLLSIVIMFTLQVFFFYSVIVTIKYIGNSLDGKKDLGKAYLDSFRCFFPFIWLIILFELCIFGASLFLIIPGIVVAVYLQVASYLVIDGKYKGISALSASFELVKGKWWKVFGRISLVAFLNIVFIILWALVFVGGAYLFSHAHGSFFEFCKNHIDVANMAIIISSWIFCVFSMPYFYVLYRSLLKAGEHKLTEGEIQKSKGFFMGLSIWGLVSGVLFFILAISILLFVIIYNLPYNDNFAGSSFATTTQQEMLTYIDPVYTYSIEYPKDWDVTSDNGSSDAMFFIASAEQSAQNGWNLRGSVVVNIWASSSALNMDQLAQMYETGVANESKTLNDRWTIYSKKSITFEGVPAYEYLSTKLRTFDDGSTYVMQKNQDIVFTKDDLIYNISYHAGTDNFDILLPVAEKMIASFKAGKYPQFNPQ